MGGNNGGNNSGMGGIGQMMAMSMFMGGNKDNNPFEGMFDFNLDTSVDDDDDDDAKKEEE